MTIREPVLAAKELPPGTDGYQHARSMRVFGGLHYIKGNKAPYFSLTYWAHRKGRPNVDDSGGAGHEFILEHFPQFSDLASLHLADMDGVPSHVEANGWYWMAGALGGMGERYHGGNSKGHYGGQYREPTEEECLEVFRKLWRMDLFRAQLLRKECREGGRKVLAEMLEVMRPQWKQEAADCIAKHGLVVYGDPWPVKAEG